MGSFSLSGSSLGPGITGYTPPAPSSNPEGSGTAWFANATAMQNTAAGAVPGTSVPAQAGPQPPTNVCVLGGWSGLGCTDQLSWADPASGKASTNVYQEDALIGNTTGSGFTVPVAQWSANAHYWLTTVDALGRESIPSAPSYAAGSVNPAALPAYAATPPLAPGQPAVFPEWNLGAPRNRVIWPGDPSCQAYGVLRDGVPVCTGLWGTVYIDNSVSPGAAHTYTVVGLSQSWTAAPGSLTTARSAPSPAATATALSAPPAALPTPLTVASVVPHDDSAMVFVNVPPGAMRAGYDFQAFNVLSPNNVKFAGWCGTGQSPDMAKNNIPALPPPSVVAIDVKGLDPALPNTLIVQMVDKIGPFQKMDNPAEPGMAQPNGSMLMYANGQSDPSSVPNVLAATAPFIVSCVPLATSPGATQVFTENGRGVQPLVSTPVPADIASISTPYFYITQCENDKWLVRGYGIDTDMSRLFASQSHWMWTTYDGPSWTQPFSHDTNASMALIPKRTFDLSGGGVLHVRLRIDCRMTNRRWLDLQVFPAGDSLLRPVPQKLGCTGPGTTGQNPTTSGRMFAWEVMPGNFLLDLFTPSGTATGPAGVTLLNDLFQAASADDAGLTERDIYAQVWGASRGLYYANGSPQGLDRAHTLDLYLSQNRYRAQETMEDGVSYLRRDRAFPAGLTLGMSAVQVAVVSELYHTSNDRPEQLPTLDSNYWVNYRPYCDERHADDFLVEVLPSFPA